MPDGPVLQYSSSFALKATGWFQLAARLERHTKVKSVRTSCNAAAWETALPKGYRPPTQPVKGHGRSIEGVNGPRKIVVLAK